MYEVTTLNNNSGFGTQQLQAQCLKPSFNQISNFSASYNFETFPFGDVPSGFTFKKNFIKLTPSNFNLILSYSDRHKIGKDLI